MQNVQTGQTQAQNTNLCTLYSLNGHLSREPVTSRWSVESRVRQVTASLCPEHTQVAALSLVSSMRRRLPLVTEENKMLLLIGGQHVTSGVGLFLQKGGETFLEDLYHLGVVGGGGGVGQIFSMADLIVSRGRSLSPCTRSWGQGGRQQSANKTKPAATIRHIFYP